MSFVASIEYSVPSPDQDSITVFPAPLEAERLLGVEAKVVVLDSAVEETIFPI